MERMKTMTERKIIVILALCLMLLSAVGETHLAGHIEENILLVSWRVPAGNCELTVSLNDWPVCVRNVTGGEGSLSIPLDDLHGPYTLQLRSDAGCWTAKVSGGSVVTEAPAPTEAPTAAPTEVPTVEPAAAPTAIPTAKSTLIVTKAPAATPKTAQPVVSNRGDLASRAVSLVNEERAKQGLGTLRVDSELTRAACVRAGELTQVFSHTRPDGSKWSTVSASAYAENIARGQRTADKVMAAWLSSSDGHRENILRPSYGSIGVCAFDYNGVIYWVQLFGR